MDTSIGIWEDRDGRSIRVTIVRGGEGTWEICPKCLGSLKTLFGTTDDGERLSRFECLMCSWASEAFPAYQARPGSSAVGHSSGLSF